MKCQSETILKQKAVEGGGFAISFSDIKLITNHDACQKQTCDCRLCLREVEGDLELGRGIPKSRQIRRLLKTKESHNPLYFPSGFIFRLNQLLKKDINFRKCRKKSFYDRVAKGLVHVDSQTVTIQ